MSATSGWSYHRDSQSAPRFSQLSLTGGAIGIGPSLAAGAAAVATGEDGATGLPVDAEAVESLVRQAARVRIADLVPAGTEAGLMALRERRMKVTAEDFKKSKENVLYRKKEGTPEGLYL